MNSTFYNFEVALFSYCAWGTHSPDRMRRPAARAVTLSHMRGTGLKVCLPLPSLPGQSMPGQSLCAGEPLEYSCCVPEV